MPAFFESNLETIAAPLLAGRKWTQVKIPGLREQVLNAHLNGVNCIWDNIEPGFANVTYDAKVDQGVISLILDLGGLVQSSDGGATWRQLSYQLPGNGVCAGFYSFDISPVDAKRVLVAGQYLSYSADGGATWNEVREPALPPISISPTAGMSIKGYRTSFGKVRYSCNGARVFTALGGLGHDRKQRNGIEDEMAAMFPEKKVFVGDGAGANFVAVALGSFSGVRCICPHPTDPDTVYVSFGDGTLFVSRNASAASPVFQPLNVPAGYEVIDIDVSPWTQGDLLLTLMLTTDTTKGKISVAHDSGTAVLSYADVAFKDSQGNSLYAASFVSARWNPRLRGQAFVGMENVGYLLASDDGLKTFRKIVFPSSLAHDQSGFYTNAQRLFFDRKTDLAVTTSDIGGWWSTDRFATWNDLLMTYDDGAKLYGNKGVGFAECAVSIVLGRKGCAYLATNDHGLFRSNGADRSRWTRISKNPGMPDSVLFFPLGVSPDESCLYAIARGPTDYYSNNTMKLVRSLDRGDTWADVTGLLASGTYLPNDQTPRRFSFSPDAKYQWLQFDSVFYVSTDSGKTFSVAQVPFDTGASGFGFTESAYDAARGILYLGSNAGLAKSLDGGVTWTRLNTAYTPGVGVTGSGDLVLGFFGRLLVVPYDQIDVLASAGKLTPSLAPAAMVKATIGDNVLEATSSLSIFNRITCDGDTVVVACGAGAYLGNRTCNAGPLISFDGGETFAWAQYDLPNTTIFCAAVSADEIFLGCGGGAYRWDRKRALLVP